MFIRSSFSQGHRPYLLRFIRSLYSQGHLLQCEYSNDLYPYRDIDNNFHICTIYILTEINAKESGLAGAYPQRHEGVGLRGGRERDESGLGEMGRLGGEGRGAADGDGVSGQKKYTKEQHMESEGHEIGSERQNGAVGMGGRMEGGRGTEGRTGGIVPKILRSSDGGENTCKEATHTSLPPQAAAAAAEVVKRVLGERVLGECDGKPGVFLSLGRMHNFSHARTLPALLPCTHVCSVF